MPTTKQKRNDKIADKWSLVHFTTGIALVVLLQNVSVLVLWLGMAAWEPLEIFVISPLLAKRGITFGYESWRNSLSDIVFNTLGLVVGMVIFR